MSFFLLALGLLLDISTRHSLVVAILYNIPIALSSLALSRRLTLSLMVLALLANAIAGYVNALILGGVDTIALLNRTFAGLSFLLVGFLTLALRNASSRVTILSLEKARAQREHDLRRMAAELSGPLRPQVFLERSCAVLRTLLGAKSIIISGLSGNRFAEPRYSSPPDAALAAGDLAPWIIAATPTTEPPVFTARLDTVAVTIGRWRRESASELIVIALESSVPEPSLLLAEALRDLEPLLERAVLLENLERQRAELSRRNAVIRDLVYAFSHDLRTPLIANAMNMRLALEGAFGEISPEYRRSLQNGLDANQNLLELADSLLLLARLESGEFSFQPEPVELVKLLREAVARLESVWQSKQLRIILSAPDNLTVSGHPAELRRVLQNLLDNAAKFSPPCALVEITLCGTDRAAVLEVLDRGPGIAGELQDRLFQRFSSGKVGGGSGLGLYLARQIVSAHGGRIDYAPREEGGSRFTISLPLKAS